MRTNHALNLKAAVTNNDIETVLRLRRVYEAQKARLEMAETALNEAESAVMSKIQSGAPVVSRHEVNLKSVSRRNIPWKGIVCQLIGGERTEQILRDAEPTITYRLQIQENKEAA